MAIDAHSTPAPAVQPGLLRTWAGAVPVPLPDLTAETVAMLDAIPALALHGEARMTRHGGASVAEIQTVGIPTVSVSQGHAASQRQPHEMVAENDGVEISTPCISQGEAADVRHRGAGEVCCTVQQTAVADFASARHMRRALEGALDHGTALLAALGLPMLVEPGFVPLDPSAIDDALDTAIATLDALDAPGVDLEDDGTAEPWLGWIDGKPVLSDSHDDREAEDNDEPILGAPERHPSCYQFALCDATSSQEYWADGSARNDEAEAVDEDGGDILDEDEETLGWAANVAQLALGQTTADGDETALERHGRGFVRSGPEDAEDDDPAGGQQRDEDALFWSIDVGCAMGAPLDVDGAHV